MTAEQIKEYTLKITRANKSELLYQAEQGEMVVVRGNQSDIVSNIEVVVRANGQDLVYNPSLSLEDGRVLTKGRVVDVTRYDDME